MLLAPHDLHRLLNEEKRRADIDVHDLVVALFGGVENVAAIGEAGGVDENIDAAELAVGLGDHGAAFVDIGEIGRDEKGRAASRPQFGGDPLAVAGVATADDEAGRAALGEQARDRFAEALRPAGDHRELSR